MKKIKKEQMGFKGIRLLNPGEMNQLVGSNGESRKACSKGDSIICIRVIANVVTCATAEVSCRPSTTFTASCSGLTNFNIGCGTGGTFTVKPKP